MASDQHLDRARRELEAAVALVDDESVRDRLRDTAATFAQLSAGDRPADHAAFDEYLNALRQAAGEVDGEPADRLDAAIEHAEAYRESLGRG